MTGRSHYSQGMVWQEKGMGSGWGDLEKTKAAG